jgi:hypothetical protein
MVSSEKLKRAESKQALSTFTLNKNFATLYPDFSYAAVSEMINKDPVARGALTHFIDKCMEGDYITLSRDTLEYDAPFQNKLQRDYNFRTAILRKIFALGKMYNNVFLEIVKTDTKVIELNVLDTTAVEPITKPNGDLLRLKSKQPNPDTGKYAEWPESEIVWFKFNDITRGYAPVDLRSVWETILIKDYIRQYVAWLWKTGQYRLLYKFDNSSEQDINDFISYLKKHDNDFQRPFLVKGKLETQILRDVKETDAIDKLFKYLDNQILIAMRIPPNDAGIPDASGRSNADAQTNNLATHISSMKTVVADAINNDLFPKMSSGNSLLRFAPIDRYAEKQVFEVLQLMQSMNVSKDVMKEYMVDKGVVFKAAEWFVELPVVGDAASMNPRSKDTAPSRMGKGAGEGNQAQEQSTTRPDQLKKV